LILEILKKNMKNHIFSLPVPYFFFSSIGPKIIKNIEKNNKKS